MLPPTEPIQRNSMLSAAVLVIVLDFCATVGFDHSARRDATNSPPFLVCERRRATTSRARVPKLRGGQNPDAFLVSKLATERSLSSRRSREATACDSLGRKSEVDANTKCESQGDDRCCRVCVLTPIASTVRRRLGQECPSYDDDSGKSAQATRRSKS